MKKDEEIVSATLEVLLPIWETRFVTLVGDNLTVYKGKDASSDVLMSSNLNDMIVQPTKDAYFQISEKYESDTKAYNHVLGLKTTKTKNPAAWLKQLATFYEKGTPSTLRRNLGHSSLPTMSSPNPSPLSMRREISDPTGKNMPQSPSTPIRSGSLRRLHRSGTHTTITTNDSFMQSIDEDATLERTQIDDGDSSTGYISPSDIAARPQITLASPAATVTLQTLLEEFSEEAEGRQTPENIDEIETEIDNGLRLDETQLVVQDKVAAWMDQQDLSAMQDDDLVKAYLDNPPDYDSDRSSGGSDENVETEWLKESFSAANSFNLNSSNVFPPRPKQPQLQNVYSRLFDQFDGDHFEHRSFQETFSSDFDFGTQFSCSKTKTTTHVYEQFVPMVREENFKKTLRVETKEESECIEMPPRRSRK